MASPRSLEVYTSSETFNAPSADWPGSRWWDSYGDAQLTRLIDEALASAPNLAQAEARLRQAEAAAQQAGANLAPTLGTSAAVNSAKQSYNNGAPAAATPHGWNETAQANLNFSYEFDFWGKNRAALSAATSAAEAAAAETAAARLTLATAIASAYADLSRAYAHLDSAEDAVRARTATAELIRMRLEQGLENRGALSRAVSGQASAESELAATREAILLTNNRIAALLGVGPDRGLAIERPRLTTVAAFGLPTDIEINLIGRRPDVLAARKRADAAAHHVKSAKAAFYPNVNLTAIVGFQAMGLDLITRSGSEYGNVGPAISLPIFTGGQLEGAYRGARAEYDAAIASYESAIVQALKDVADVTASWKALDQRLAKSRGALEASLEARQIVQSRYLGGLSSYIEVLTVEDSVTTNQRNVAELETHAFALSVALVRALGGSV